jgi:endonuclease/exonuclease/phosphatase family metal-dependent hydrolase
MRRRSLLGGVALAAQAQTQPQAAEGLRTMSYNILACLGFPETDKNRERFRAMAPQQLMRMAHELLLYRPDLVTFSESVVQTNAERMAAAMGMNVAWFPPGVPSFKGYPIGFPGTVLTRHKILESQNAPGNTDPELYTRHWGRAVIRTASEEIVVHSGHLNPHKSEIRMKEIDGMLRVMEQDQKPGRSILLQGDLNHRPEAPEYQRWVQAGFVDTFAAKGVGQPFTSSPIAPKGRIDYIWVHGPLAARLSEARCLFEGAFRTNPDDPQSVALSDHLPVMAVFG